MEYVHPKPADCLRNGVFSHSGVVGSFGPMLASLTAAPESDLHSNGQAGEEGMATGLRRKRSENS